MAHRKQTQLELRPRTWGGRRDGAGRKRIRSEGVAHRSRPPLASRIPVHVTMRMCKGVLYLRGSRAFRVIERELRRGLGRFHSGVTHFSVQSNHIHLIIESSDERRMTAAIKSLSIRLAKSLNRLMKRHGQVIAERYDTHYLRTPSEVRHAVTYVLRNHTKHTGAHGEDPFASLANPELVVA